VTLPVARVRTRLALVVLLAFAALGAAASLSAERPSAAALAAASAAGDEHPRAAAAPAASETRTVVRASDGDTLVLEDGERVRLIGVDTPETHHADPRVRDFAAAATRFTRDLTVGRSVTLSFEPRARYDRYGRTLAYVTLPDGELLNLMLVREGYGFAYTRFPFALRKEFQRAEADARRAHRGLWADLGDAARRNALPAAR
jgi:micrococcal nuclease